MDSSRSGWDLKNSMSATLFAYITRAHGEAAVAEVIERAGETRELSELMDATRWSSYDAMRTLFEVAAVVVDDGELGRKVGAEIYLASRPQDVLDRLRALGHPGAVIAYVAETASRQSNVTAMECISAGPRHALVASSTVPPFERAPLFCDYIAGMLSAVPTIFDLGLADVIEVECQARGAARCLHLATWQPIGAESHALELDARDRRIESITLRSVELAEMAAELVAANDRGAVLEEIVQRAASATRAKCCVLAVRLPNETAVRSHVYGVDADDAAAIVSKLLNGEPIGGESLIAPVASSNFNFGAIAVSGPEADRFLPEETRLFPAYAGQAAAVLESIVALAEARERAATQSMLVSLAAEFAELTTKEDVVRRLARALPAVASGADVVIYACDVSVNSLVRIGPTADDAATPSEHSILRRCSALLAHVVAHPEPFVVDDEIRQSVPKAMLERREGTALVLVPIVSQREPFGVIALYLHADAVAGLDLEPIAGVARFAATAFHNARLVHAIGHERLHDPLTDLPNRALVLDRIERSLSSSRGDDRSVAVLLIDIDGFQAINDTFGHEAGDALLRDVAARLTAAMPASSTVGRGAGDEFLVVLEGGELLDGTQSVAERFRSELQRPFVIARADRSEIALTASVGIAIGSSSSGPELMRDADIAMHRAKNDGRDRAVVFSEQMRGDSLRRLEKIDRAAELRTALERDEFYLVYQPTVALATRRIVGAEALIRWRHPERGVIPPDDFIPLLEESGLIVQVGRWVLEHACMQLAEWLSSGYEVELAVNLSPRQFEAGVLVEDVRTILAATGVDPRHLVLELTETFEAEMDSVCAQLKALQELGIRVAIDDCGTGYAALVQLKDIPSDIWKIDRSFVSSATSVADDGWKMVRMLLKLALDFGRSVVAEGIEERFQLDQIQLDWRSYFDERGDDPTLAGLELFGQGYLFSRPLERDPFELLLRDGALAAEPATGRSPSGLVLFSRS
jgi:diguanylate cyclase (GGDEF)-like protein